MVAVRVHLDSRTQALLERWRASQVCSVYARISVGLLLVALLQQRLEQEGADQQREKEERAREMVEKYRPKIEKVVANALRYYGEMHSEDDLRSAAMDEAYRGLLRFDPSLGFSPAGLVERCALAGCQNLAYKHKRFAQKLVSYDAECGEGTSYLELFASEDDDPHASLERRERSAQVERAIQSLDGRKERAVIRAVQRGESLHKAARRLGCSARDVQRKFAAALAVQEKERS